MPSTELFLQIRDGTSDILYRLNQQKFEVRRLAGTISMTAETLPLGPRPRRGRDHQDNSEASLGYGGDFPKPDRLEWNMLLGLVVTVVKICIRQLYSYDFEYILCRYEPNFLSCQPGGGCNRCCTYMGPETLTRKALSFRQVLP